MMERKSPKSGWMWGGGRWGCRADPQPGSDTSCVTSRGVCYSCFSYTKNINQLLNDLGGVCTAHHSGLSERCCQGTAPLRTCRNQALHTSAQPVLLWKKQALTFQPRISQHLEMSCILNADTRHGGECQKLRHKGTRWLWAPTTPEQELQQQCLHSHSSSHKENTPKEKDKKDKSGYLRSAVKTQPGKRGACELESISRAVRSIPNPRIPNPGIQTPTRSQSQGTEAAVGTG